MDPINAHTPGPAGWHTLDDHSRVVAEMTAEFAEPFGLGQVARCLGIGHDAGKSDPRFQAYLEACHEGRAATKCPHAHAGAVASYGFIGAFALAIAGHHAGIPDASEYSAIKANVDASTVEAARAWLAANGWPQEGRVTVDPRFQTPLRSEMAVRMAFSCLVDADYLDTEAHFQPDAGDRRGAFQPLSWYRDRLDEKLAHFPPPDTPVNLARAEILAACRDAAERAPSVFRLTVPTGGGKTLSGLEFALEHALKNNLRRVIVAIPYTSIIDQTAAVYAGVFGPEALVEHHSAADWDDVGEGQDEVTRRRKLATENWDCPLVVTTTVQLFESLLANRPSRCRKLHNVAGSVIIVDEVQALPAKLLGPILDVLYELVANYGCSVVLSSATQPDYSQVELRLETQATEIVPDYPRHFKTLARVHYDVVQEPWSLAEVAKRVRLESQCLVVLNSRKDALALAREVGDAEGLYHLSTLLCGHHRKQVIADVAARLKAKEPVRLVSTQVVEAGVDLDFPVVFRALGPLDRIVQSAGRCNREGKLPEPGVCTVFRLAEGRAPKGEYATATATTETFLRERPGTVADPETMRAYTGELYRLIETGSTVDGANRASIQRARKELAFRSVAEAFRMIDQDTVSVIVETYAREDVPQVIDSWQERPGGWFRRVGPFTVCVYQHELRRLERDGQVRPHESGAWLYSGPYDDTFGLSPDLTDPADLVVSTS